MIDNNWKILHNPGKGQCDFQPPYSDWTNKTQLDKLKNGFFLFDLDKDWHELNDLSESEPEQFKRMSGLLADFLASVENSQQNETHCGKYNPTSTPTPTPATFADGVCGWTVCQQGG